VHVEYVQLDSKGERVMKYLGHYLIHHTGWMDVALELGTILDELNIARNERRYTVYTHKGFFGMASLIDGMIMYYREHMEEKHVINGVEVKNYTHGHGVWFSWEVKARDGHTLAPAKSTSFDLWPKYPTCKQL